MIDRLDESLDDALAWLQRVGPTGTDESTDERDAGDGGSASDSGTSIPVEAQSDGGRSDIDSGLGKRNGTPADDKSGSWKPVDSPTSRTIHGVVHGQDGPYACGEGGLLLHRSGEGWRVLLERGPGVAENTLRSIAATDDGCRLWFAGDSGALGYYDVADGHLSDYSAPMEKTSTWEAIAVTGKTGEERIRVANGSGEVLDCTVADGCPTWGEVVEPGGGSTIPGLTAGPDGFYAVDTSGGAYHEPRAEDSNGNANRHENRNRDGNANRNDSAESDPRDGEPADTEPTDSEPTDEWTKIGVRNAQVDFQDIWAGEESVFIAGADGIAYRYDPRCENWTPIHVGQGALQAIRSVGTDAVAVANGGRIYEREESIRWTECEVPTEQSLLGLALARSSADVENGLATVSVDVAVGAGGVILERDRRDRSSGHEGSQ